MSPLEKMVLDRILSRGWPQNAAAIVFHEDAAVPFGVLQGEPVCQKTFMRTAEVTKEQAFDLLVQTVRDQANELRRAKAEIEEQLGLIRRLAPTPEETMAEERKARENAARHAWNAYMGRPQ